MANQTREVRNETNICDHDVRDRQCKNNILGESSIYAHVVEPDELLRPLIFRDFCSADIPCELYSSIDELSEYGPQFGTIFLHDGPEGMTFREAMSHLSRTGPALEIVAFSTDPSVEKVVSAMKAGASNYVGYPFEPASIRRVFRMAYEGRRNSQIDILVRGKDHHDIKRLSTREREVFELLLDGYSNKKVAEHLGISHRTVESHRCSVFNKLGVKTIAAAAVVWISIVESISSNIVS